MRTTEEIVHTFKYRQFQRGPFFERCREISQHYDNEVALPLPEIGEKERPAVANLLAQGIDQHATRITSYLPDPQCPPLKIGDRASERRADQRRRSCIGYWETNSYDLIQRKRARWLVAYSQAPIRLVPNKAMGQPQWIVRSPLETYPADLEFPNMQPADCIFAVQRTVGWLRQTYPDVPVTGLQLPGSSRYAPGRSLTDSDVIDILEYTDKDQTTVLALGCGTDPSGLVYEAEYGIQDARIVNLGPVGGPDGPKMWAAPLTSGPNRLGECAVVVPGRISLGLAKGQMDDTVGLYQMQAKLMAMEVNAVANGIWPDEWLIGINGNEPKIITAADGRKGVVGVAMDGQFVTRQIQPGLQTPTTIDRLERGIRHNGQIPAELNGEAASNIRTARRGNDLLSSAVDFTIQEHQQILARSAQTELQIAANIDLTYFRNTPKSFYVSWKGGKGRLDYTPKDIWAEDRTVKVSYAKPGADINELNVQIGQLVSTEIMSKLTGSRMHPDVLDPEFEHDQIVFESLERAALTALQQGAASGALPLTDVAFIARTVRSDKMDLFDAVDEAQKAAQQRQSSTVAPAEPGSPEAQPGLSPPGAGAEAGTAIGPPSPSMDNLSQVLRAIRTPAQIARAG